MRSIIIYYSYSGNTKKVVQILSEYLREKSETEILELKVQNESTSFFGQCQQAFWHKQTEIGQPKFNLKPYDLVCLGTPVWAFGPAPAMNTYLDKCSGLEDKEVILFTTYGSGVGNSRCLNYMQKILSKKGVRSFRRFSMQQFKVDDKEFVLSRIKEKLIYGAKP
jgi:flavodoxin